MEQAARPMQPDSVRARRRELMGALRISPKEQVSGNLMPDSHRGAPRHVSGGGVQSGGQVPTGSLRERAEHGPREDSSVESKRGVEAG